MERTQILLIVVAIFALFSVLHSSSDIRVSTAGLFNDDILSSIHSSMIPEQTPSCLGLGFRKDMDHLLSKYKQVWVIMPAKAAVTSFKEFTKDCMAKAGTPSFSKIDNPFTTLQRSKDAFLGQLEQPSLVASHLYHFHDDPFCNVMKHASAEDTLVVYSHREETSRLISSIKEVVTIRLCKQKPKITKLECGGKLTGCDTQCDAAIIALPAALSFLFFLKANSATTYGDSYGTQL